MKYAIIGLGFIAPRHIEAIRHVGGELVITCDTERTKAIPGIPFVTHYKFMSAHPRWNEVEAVVVCAPNDLHAEMSLWACRQGKKVLCEKPLFIDEMENVRFAGLQDLFGVMQLRYHPVLEKLKKEKIESLELHVAVKRGESYWDGWKGNPARSGGILFNIGVHYFDALMQILDTPVVNVTVEERSKNRVKGTLQFEKFPGPVPFDVSVDADVPQDRYVLVNGEKHRFSDKDNLSFEDLHKKVYEDFELGKGVRPRDVLSLTRLIERIKRA